MPERESWTKALRCPVCGLEGVATLSHIDDPNELYETKTELDECPSGFVTRDDEDDSNIIRFFCAVDQVPADE